jgi:hypothetical protein
VKRITNNTAVMITLVGVMSFWILLPIFGPVWMLEISSNLMLGVFLAVMIKWAVPAYDAIKDGGQAGPNFLSMALFGIGGSLVVWRFWNNVVRWASTYDGQTVVRPTWAVDSPVTAFAIWCLAVAGAMIVLAPGTERGIVPKGNIFWLLGSVSFGSLAAGVMIGVSIAGV